MDRVSRISWIKEDWFRVDWMLIRGGRDPTLDQKRGGATNCERPYTDSGGGTDTYVLKPNIYTEDRFLVL